MPLPFSRARFAYTSTFLKTCTLTLFYISAPLLYVNRYHYSLYNVIGPSMSPTLSPTYHETREIDRVLFRKNVRVPLVRRPTYTQEDQALEQGNAEETDRRVLRRGQIIAFWTPHDPNKIAVKRIVAMAGDVVRPLRRNGSPYYHDETEAELFVALPRDGDDIGPPTLSLNARPADVSVTIPFNHVWVEGDNQDLTSDSNDYGPISMSLVDGIAGAIVFPSARRGWKDWTRDGWEKRCKGRITWRGAEEDASDDWEMYE